MKSSTATQRPALSATGALPTRRAFKTPWDEISYLYHKALFWFYGPTRRPARARPFAVRLERSLRETRDAEAAILGQDAWALVTEIDGDLRRAIRHRLRSIALVRRFMALPEYPGLVRSSSRVFHGQDDVVDRLVLVAVLHRDAGERRQAARRIEEARTLAAAHRLRFAERPLWRDLCGGRTPTSTPRAKRGKGR